MFFSWCGLKRLLFRNLAIIVINNDVIHIKKIEKVIKVIGLDIYKTPYYYLLIIKKISFLLNSVCITTNIDTFWIFFDKIQIKNVCIYLQFCPIFNILVTWHNFSPVTSLRSLTLNGKLLFSRETANHGLLRAASLLKESRSKKVNFLWEARFHFLDSRSLFYREENRSTDNYTNTTVGGDKQGRRRYFIIM